MICAIDKIDELECLNLFDYSLTLYNNVVQVSLQIYHGCVIYRDNRLYCFNIHKLDGNNNLYSD